MLGRRLAYLAVLTLSFLLYLLYKEWFSWLVLMAVAWLPLLSLAISLPAMVMLKASLQCPTQVRQGVPARTGLRLQCRLPVPPVSCRIRLHNRLTGERYVGLPGEHVPVSHCGVVDITYKRLWIYDYLGLFRWGMKQKAPCRVYIEPKPLPTREPVPVEQQLVSQWKPKAGGGFSENHDLRLYRPGDNLRQIHWKMAAKTGKLIYREPIVPVQKEVSLVLTLSGTPEQLDRKLGRLLWTSRQLLGKELHHEICCQTGSGVLRLEVTDLASQEKALHTLLCSPATTGEWIPEGQETLWQCLIGGEPCEA